VNSTAKRTPQERPLRRTQELVGRPISSSRL
jgi:hypothetical protein